MLALKAIDVKNNFKSICAQVFNGETVMLSRPKNQNIVMISEAEYNRLEKARRNLEYMKMPDESDRQLASTVSGAIILRTNADTGKKEVFATQRGYGDWKGWWEIPGGKIEPGETPEQCIVREIREELATEVRAEKVLGVVEYDYPAFHLTMHCILCTIVSGEPKLLEHEAARWLNADTLYSVDWLPADKLILNKVAMFLQGKNS